MISVDYNLLRLTQDDLLLDLGCGQGRHAFGALKQGAKVVALDISLEELGKVRAMVSMMVQAGQVAPSGSYMVCADATALPFKNGSFEKIIASEVLEHVTNDSDAMLELNKSLKPKGVLAVTVPRFGPELINWALSDSYHSRPGGHVRIYRRSILYRRLKKVQFSPFASHYAHGLHSPYWWLRCLVGVDNDNHPLVRIYHRLLVLDITSSPKITQMAEKILNPFIGKSLVVYLEKTSNMTPTKNEKTGP
ncbi:MAG: class I SAM-dependent methyltransferase [Actinobacteria bacterium]|nr:class I SAM-dependent methyltransferase [Actinomycetota bacterium]MCL6104604.1 class I SAM-dependent methyltransferase [Actinomycetota bacterium]